MVAKYPALNSPYFQGAGGGGATTSCRICTMTYLLLLPYKLYKVME